MGINHQCHCAAFSISTPPDMTENTDFCLSNVGSKCVFMVVTVKTKEIISPRSVPPL